MLTTGPMKYNGRDWIGKSVRVCGHHPGAAGVPASATRLWLRVSDRPMNDCWPVTFFPSIECDAMRRWVWGHARHRPYGWDSMLLDDLYNLLRKSFPQLDGDEIVYGYALFEWE